MLGRVVGWLANQSDPQPSSPTSQARWWGWPAGQLDIFADPSVGSSGVLGFSGPRGPPGGPKNLTKVGHKGGGGIGAKTDVGSLAPLLGHLGMPGFLINFCYRPWIAFFRFWCQLGSKLGPVLEAKIAPKSLQEASKMH